MRSILLLSLAAFLPAQDSRRPPNVVLIVSDDAGYADFSMHGSKEFATPRIDSIARQGVRFAQGYVTAPVCSPSRAGLLTGRYQQRFGHERNIPPRYSEVNGLPRSERTIADHLEDVGYRTVALGKWHLGYAPHFHPLSRGFQQYHGFLQGARPYFPLQKATRLNRLLSDRKPVPETFEYMTDELGAAAARSIAEHKDAPFFVYLSFNAVHGPMHALDADLALAPEGFKPRRRKLWAMTRAMDRAVGVVLDALEDHELTENTIVVFLNDNGGATNNASSNGALRGKKGTPYEGGIRVPFAVRWPLRLKGGQVYEAPISALDILPTVLAAAGLERLPGNLDGVDLMPYLLGAKEGRPHERLFWLCYESKAVRIGDLKLASSKGGPWQLFDLASDPGEQADLLTDRPRDGERLLAEFEAWCAQMAKPLWGR